MTFRKLARSTGRVLALMSVAALGLPAMHSAGAAGDPCAAPANAVVGENCLPGSPASRVGRQRWRRPVDPGLRHPDQRQRRSVRALQGRHRRDRVHDRHLPDGLLRRRRRPSCRDVSPRAPRCRRLQPACLERRRDRPGRLRQLGGVGVVDRARRRGLRACTSRSSRDPTPAARARSRSSSATTRATPTSCSRRRTRPGRRTTPTAGTACTPAGPVRTPGARTRSATTGRSRPAGRLPKTSFFNAEYPMVRWLEANGYDVSYHERHRHRPRPGERARSSTRCSCRSVTTSTGRPTSARNVEAARDAGVNLAFFSGNQIFWKTRWEPSIDGTATTYRTLVSYKETHAAAKIDPDPAVDRDLAGPAGYRLRGQPPGERARPERSSRPTAARRRSRCRRPTSDCGCGATRASSTLERLVGDAGRRVARLRVERRRRQRVAPAGSDRPVLDDARRGPGPAGPGFDVRAPARRRTRSRCTAPRAARWCSTPARCSGRGASTVRTTGSRRRPTRRCVRPR